MDAYIERGIGEVDEGEVLAFVNTILEGECGLRVREPLRRSIRDYFAAFDPENRLFVALYREDRLRAVLAVDRVSDERAILKWVFVAPDDRQHGLGSQLVDRAIAFARAAGYTRLVLGTMARMEAAHRLYEKKGFAFAKQVTFWHRPMMIYEKALVEGGGQEAAKSKATTDDGRWTTESKSKVPADGGR